MRAVAGLAVAAALVAGAPATAGGSGSGSGSRTVRLPNLVGLSRTHAEARLTQAGLRYLLPTPRAQRYDAVSPADGAVERAMPEDAVPDRTVVVQEPAAGGQRVDRGDFITFGTVLPEGATAEDDADVPFTRVRRIAVAADGRRVTLGFRALAPRCQPLDHVDVGYAPRYVTASPTLTSTFQSEEHCRRGFHRAARFELSEQVGDRVVLDLVPTRPVHRLHHVRSQAFTRARGQPRARAVAVTFGHSSDCGLLAGYRVHETKEVVQITLRTGDQHRGRLCLLNLIEDAAVIPLRQPLGDRRIVDGAAR